MSANDHHTGHEEGHTGPVKTPGQLLLTVFYSFVVPVFGIIALVYFVVSAPKPMAGGDNSEKAVAERIQKVGSVEIRDANRPLKAGEEVYNAQCAACHNAGAAGAPKLGDAGAWAIPPRPAPSTDRRLAKCKGVGCLENSPRGPETQLFRDSPLPHAGEADGEAGG